MRNVLAAAALFATAAFAQTSSDCNPLSKTDCPVNPAIGMSNWTWIPDGSLNSKIWNDTGYVGTTAGSGYVNFTMSKTKDAPTIKTKGYFFFGSVSVVAQMAPGTGVISAITLLSDDLDEIDFEFKGGEKNRVFTNYYGKHGNQDKPQGGMKDGDGADFPTSFDVTTGYHNYTINWSNDTIQWLVDDKVIRTSKSSDEKAQGGKTFPQTPMSLYLGNWAGGDSSEPGTVSWAGGKTDWSKAPFMMSVKSVYVSDAMGGSSGPVKEYKYGDTSGSAKSIQITKADSGQNSTFASAVAAQETDNTSLTDKAKASYNNLSTGAKIGIACGVLGVVALGVIIMAICCIKQRRAGRRERAVADAEFQKQEAELMAYRQANGQRQAFVMPAFGHQNYKQHM